MTHPMLGPIAWALLVLAPIHHLPVQEVPPAGLPAADPAAVAMDPALPARLDAVFRDSLGALEGARWLVARHGRVVDNRWVGDRAVAPGREPMTRDTIFDLASLTKPVATATVVMKLVEQGRVSLQDPITKYLPELDNHGKRAITVDHLLRHRSGLIADNPIADYADGPAAAWERIGRLELVAPPGERFLYSDVGFIVLGKLVEKVTGHPLDKVAHALIFGPLGMKDTGFRPADPSRVAPTEPFEGRMLRGEVHDPRARALGGVAGHAGLFATADDLAIYAQMLLNEGVGPNGVRILGPLTVRKMIDPGDTPARQRRGLGWDIDTSYSAPRGELFGHRGFGHTGFTGTSLWIDADTRAFAILLTSRLHPDGKGASPTTLRRQFATVVAASILDPPAPVVPNNAIAPAEAHEPSPVSPVRCGIDVLVDRKFDALQGRKVGLITNHTGRASDGRPTIDVLAGAPGVRLVALFSPEHGIRGLVDREVADDRDEATGLPIFSLYGKNRKPTPESLAGVDVLVYDIQDIGTRFYTYISTLGLALEAAAAAKIPVVVLDRPNPIGGKVFGGPIRDGNYESFIAHHALPVRHGMTVGELGRMFNQERSIGADLTVVPCQGWRRDDLFDATGLLWVNPSPNMRSLKQALLYPGVGLLEGTNLATGRGTDTPFERVGAPYIDPVRFAHDLNALGIPGLRFLPVRFTPRERQFAGEDCGGVYLEITDRAALDPLELGLGLATVLREDYRESWKPEALEKFLADRASFDAILAGRKSAAIRALWAEELAEFAERRAKYLLY